MHSLTICDRVVPDRVLHIDVAVWDPHLRAGGGSRPVPGPGRHDAGRSSVSPAGRHWSGHHGPRQSPQRLLLRHRGLGHLLPDSQPRHPAKSPLGHLWSDITLFHPLQQ